MRLDYDVRHLPRSLFDWNRLVTALGQATDDTVESSWLELKGPLDLTTAEHRFTIARAILAFANRDPDAAAPFLDGHALVVVGIGGGTISGIRRIEDHQLIKALRPYLGEDERAPRWTVYRHRVDDTSDVLIIVVDAPQAGDRIFTLQQALGNRYPGTIFSRPSTESEPADPAAVEMLSRRLVARTRDFQIDLTLNPDAITRYTWDPSILDPVLEREFQHYWSQVPQPRPLGPEAGVSRLSAANARVRASALSGMSEGMEALRSSFETRHDEDRTKEEFRQELERWTDAVRDAFPMVVLDLLSYRQPAALFTITNTCGRFLEGLEIEVHIEGPVIQHPKLTSPETMFDRLPSRPRKWGPRVTQRFDSSTLVPASTFPSSSIRRPRPNSSDFRNSGSVTAVLRCDELRPGRSHTFTEKDDHSDIVLLTDDLNLSSTRITATSTARGVDDSQVIEFAHPVTTPIDVTDHMRNLITRFDGYYFKASSKTPETK